MLGARVKLVTALAGAVLLVAACGSGGSNANEGSGGGAAGQPGSASGGMLSITAGVAATGSSTPLYLGLEKGIFKKHGIDLKIGKAATGASAITQLINGQQQVALGGISPVITAAAAGIKIEIVSGSYTDQSTPQGTIDQTIVKGDGPIKSFKDLTGKTIGVNSLKCCWEFWMREAVDKDGGDASKLHFVQLTFADQVTALKQGKVDAISTTQPYATQLRQVGYRDIGDSASVAFGKQKNGNTVYYMAKSFVEKHPDAISKWRAAVQEASDYANKHPDEVRASIVKQTSVDANLLKKTPMLYYTATIDRSSIQKAVQFNVKYGVIKKAPELSSFVAP